MGLAWCCLAVWGDASVKEYFKLWQDFYADDALLSQKNYKHWLCVSDFHESRVMLLCCHGNWSCGLFFRLLWVWGDSALLSQKLILGLFHGSGVMLLCCHGNWGCGLFLGSVLLSRKLRLWPFYFLFFRVCFAVTETETVACFSDFRGSGVSLWRSCPSGGHCQWGRLPKPSLLASTQQQEHHVLQGKAHSERGTVKPLSNKNTQQVKGDARWWNIKA